VCLQELKSTNDAFPADALAFLFAESQVSPETGMALASDFPTYGHGSGYLPRLGPEARSGFRLRRGPHLWRRGGR
jgi:hypothetical protein